MGKKMIRASIWTCRSLLSLYSKAMAFIFAVFCVVSGMSAGTVSIKDGASGKISGKALQSSDSTALKNIKIFMGNIVCPVYGVGLCCSFGATDSTVTDSLGNFETVYPEKLFGDTRVGQVVFAKVDTIKSDYRVSISEVYYLNSNSDTAVTLYLEPLVCTNILPERPSASNPILKTILGNTVSLRIGNWSSQKKYSAKIVDITGRLIASPAISQDGILTWNTAKYSRGVYLVNVETDFGVLNTKIAVK
ncbi:MAG TPA: T9SS type A sorting domain-containing protein [Chitinispirillaceae bacterium]|nr:T9SS type A sorting domain-containing protein [Chitinispirillaceae bacterium]